MIKIKYISAELLLQIKWLLTICKTEQYSNGGMNNENL
ncbi:hypothetical protein F4694_003017 [Bacillus niacini]|jgi:hypothetical protein|uniref:Uncharacterized protein n=1 Tax=Neobacillus niacini TaxID=86668 RepID=A0A852TF08_9BACI|nr:hypothetical protein [Neobacillus niacini]